MPFRIIPDLGQGPENFAKPSTKQNCDVLQDDEFGSKFANKSDDLEEEPRAASMNSSAFASGADILTREPSADDINGNTVSSKNVCCKLSNVMIAGHLRPVFRQYAAGELFDLAEGDRFKAACALQAEAESRRCPKTGPKL